MFVEAARQQGVTSYGCFGLLGHILVSVDPGIALAYDLNKNLLLSLPREEWCLTAVSRNAQMHKIAHERTATERSPFTTTSKVLMPGSWTGL